MTVRAWAKATRLDIAMYDGRDRAIAAGCGRTSRSCWPEAPEE